MGQLVKQVQTLTRGYIRKGAKDNRRQQAARMAAFATFCEGEGAQDLGQVGRRHVVRYWIDHRHLAPATLYAHHLALKILWQLAGKTGLPPEPAAPRFTMTIQPVLSTAKPKRPVRTVDGQRD